VLLRADIDGLPVVEEAAVEFRSERDGVMHACGHDAHTATLLGVAEILSARAEDLPGRHVFVFQPAEEQLAGARAMLDGGLLEGLDVVAAVGWHVNSQMPAGVIYTRPGVMLSDGQGLRITFTGTGAMARWGPQCRAGGRGTCPVDGRRGSRHGIRGGVMRLLTGDYPGWDGDERPPHPGP
jgi:amidohydrolase